MELKDIGAALGVHRPPTPDDDSVSSAGESDDPGQVLLRMQEAEARGDDPFAVVPGSRVAELEALVDGGDR